MPFLFENLDVYNKAMKLMVDIYTINGAIREKAIKDQLSRAVLSVPLNIAEGQGRMHGREKRQFYNTARGSLLECVPLLQACRSLGYFDEKSYSDLYSLADEIGKMLTGLIKSVKCE